MNHDAFTKTCRSGYPFRVTNVDRFGVGFCDVCGCDLIVCVLSDCCVCGCCVYKCGVCGCGLVGMVFVGTVFVGVVNVDVVFECMALFHVVWTTSTVLSMAT